MVLSKLDQIKVVDKEVEALLSKCTIRWVSMTSSRQVFCIFVIPKKDNRKWLKKEFLDPPHFRMAEDAADLLCPGNWMALKT